MEATWRGVCVGRLTRAKTLSCLIAIGAACVPAVAGCSQRDDDTHVVEATARVLYKEASIGAVGVGYGDNYLPKAYRRAAETLETEGAAAIRRPLLMYAVFGTAEIPGRTKYYYTISWLELGEEVKAFYLRREDGEDISLFPSIIREPMRKGTAWRVTAGPVVVSEDDRKKVTPQDRSSVIELHESVLMERKVLVGIILKNGIKMEPVEAYVGPT